MPQAALVAVEVLEGDNMKNNLQLPFIFLVFLITSCSTIKPNTVNLATQQGFNSPEIAVQELAAAAKSLDQEGLTRIFGPNFVAEVSSGDPAQDKNSLNNFANKIAEKTDLLANNKQTFLMQIGTDNFIFPVPLIKIKDLWYFDGEAGREEILNRRIGHNEISAIKVLTFFSSAQAVYASKDRDADGQLEYAERFLSTPGEQDGLYWDYATFGEPSPLGPQAARLIKEEGADGIYQGYNYQIISVPNSDNSKNNVTLLAYPLRYGISGVMSFVAGQDSKIYEQNINPEKAPGKTFDPFHLDSEWKAVIK